MSVNKMKLGAVAVLVVAAIAVVLWQRQQAMRLSTENAALREELQQAANLRDTTEQAINRLKADAQRSETERLELVRLRGQASRLRQAEQENAQLKGERDRLVKLARQSSAGETREPERTPEEKLLAAKLTFTRNLGLALILAADENEGRLPTEMPRALAQMIEVMSPEAEGIRAKQFEVVYKGSLREVKRPSDTILAREKEPFQQADGRWARTYVFADGSARRLAAETPEALAVLEKELSGEPNP